MAAERQCHRRVVPEHIEIDAVRRNRLVHERAQRTGGERRGQPTRQMRHDDRDAAAIDGRRDVRAVRGIEQRFFKEEHAPLARAAAEKMLWALVNEIPSQMREAKEIARVGARLVGSF